jgi:hypothetical protein
MWFASGDQNYWMETSISLGVQLLGAVNSVCSNYLMHGIHVYRRNTLEGRNSSCSQSRGKRLSQQKILIDLFQGTKIFVWLPDFQKCLHSR